MLLLLGCFCRRDACFCSADDLFMVLFYGFGETNPRPGCSRDRGEQCGWCAGVERQWAASQATPSGVPILDPTVLSVDVRMINHSLRCLCAIASALRRAASLTRGAPSPTAPCARMASLVHFLWRLRRTLGPAPVPARALARHASSLTPHLHPPAHPQSTPSTPRTSSSCLLALHFCPSSS